MKRFLLAILLMGGTAFGQAPPKPAPSVSVKLPDGPLVAGTLIKIDASASVGSLCWNLISLDDNSALDVHEDGLHGTFAYPIPGTYVLLVQAETVDTTGKILRADKRIPIVTNPSTPPTPTPTPTPSPDPPTPTPAPAPSKGTYLVVVADHTDPTLGPVLNGPTIAGLKSLQRGKVYGPNDADVALRHYDAAMAVKGV